MNTFSLLPGEAGNVYPLSVGVDVVRSAARAALPEGRVFEIRKGVAGGHPPWETGAGLAWYTNDQMQEEFDDLGYREELGIYILERSKA